MDQAARELNAANNPRATAPSEQHRMADVVAYHAGPPRTADIDEGNSGVTIPGVPLLECCAALAAGNRVWLIRIGDLRVILSRQA